MPGIDVRGSQVTSRVPGDRDAACGEPEDHFFGTKYGVLSMWMEGAANGEPDEE